MGPNIYQSRSHFWSWPRGLPKIFYFKWWTTRATTTTITYYSVKTPHTHSLRRFSPLVDAISPHELEVWMLFVYSLDAYIAPVSHTCVPAWRNALIYTNIMYLIYVSNKITYSALHLECVSILAVYPFVLHTSAHFIWLSCYPCVFSDNP